MDAIQKFQELLRKLFQFESADLDFGVYRILNYGREQIEEFIQKDLKREVENAFEKYKGEEIESLNRKLEEARQEVSEMLGRDALTPAGELKPEFKDTPVGRKFLSANADRDSAQSTEEIKVQVFNDLYNFFHRYYEEGDFIPQHRYSVRGHRYAIPYNGEEVKLYWANQGQYYVKTSNLFRDYTFKASDRKVIFRVVSAREELGSNKATKARFFVLDDENPVSMEDNVLVVRFQYRELTDEEVKHYEVSGGSNTAKQKKINGKSSDEILNNIEDTSLKEMLSREYRSEKSLLLYQLSRFAAKNTRDYFIHKNIKKFLSEQLDYYIKAEVLDFETLAGEDRDKHITRAKVVKEIGSSIIDFLSQIEDFQKRLWEKKKFVLRTEYVITLDKIVEYAGKEFLDKTVTGILKNKEQLAEWESLGFGKIRKKTDLIARNDLTGVEYKKLPVDTKHFPVEFKEKLLERLTENHELDDILDGLLIKSENWQALNTLLPRFREQIKCIYIDPPYNTGSDEFLYRDRYQHSSWLSMVEDRLQLARELMGEDAVLFVSNDDNEQANLRRMAEGVFGADNFVTNVVWQKKYSPQNDARWFSDNHDFLTCFAKKKETWRPHLLPRTEMQDVRYQNPDDDPRGPWMSSGLDVKTYSPEYDYEIVTPSGRVVRPPEGRCWAVPRQRFQELVADNRIWFGPRRDNVPRLKRFLSEVKQGLTPLTIWLYKEVGHNQEGKQELKRMLVEGEQVFGTPKPTRLLERVLTIGLGNEGIALDFFAGSGTTAHAVMKLNKEDGGRRKYILVEMANYFDTVIIPRIKKVAYSFNWKEGKAQDTDGIGQFFKYQTLEQYEDALDNIELKENKQAKLKFGDDYLLKYFLEFETRGNATLLNMDELKSPFSYKLKVNLEEAGEPEEVIVDIPETFNYLLGLKVKKIKARRENGRKYLFVLGEREGKDIAIVWREYNDGWKKSDFRRDKKFIVGEIEGWSPHIIYVNGQSVLTPKLGENQAEIRYIESEFKRLMESKR